MFDIPIDAQTLQVAGLAVVCLALVGAIVVIVKGVLKLIGNHMAHATEAADKLSNKIDNLIDFASKK